jgi:iron complex transport system substrate-binding protein
MVTDFRGKSITLFRPARRIVCLIESALSGIYMLGAEHQVVGISANVYEQSVFPYYAAMDSRIKNRELPTPGNWDFVNIETVISLKPDLIIIWSNQEESIAALEEYGLPVYGVFIERFEDNYKEIEDFGILTGKRNRAAVLQKTAKQHISNVYNRIEALHPKGKKRVYFMWAQGELETSGKNSTVDELITLSGGINVAGHTPQEHLVVNMENILTWNPEIVVMWVNIRKNPDDIMANALWQSVSAVKSNRVYELPDGFSCDLWTLKYIYVVTLVSKWCYPARFKDIVPEKYKWELMRGLYGQKLNPVKIKKDLD